MGSTKSGGTRARIGAGHRRMPGDVVTGTHEGLSFLGTVIVARAAGGCRVRIEITFPAPSVVRVGDEVEVEVDASAAMWLETVEEVAAPTTFSWGRLGGAGYGDLTLVEAA